MLAEVLDPRPLHARVVRGGLDEIHEVGDVRVEPLLKLVVGDAAFTREGAVCLRERKHVGVEARSEVLEGNAQRPETAFPPTIDGDAERSNPWRSLNGCG